MAPRKGVLLSLLECLAGRIEPGAPGIFSNTMNQTPDQKEIEEMRLKVRQLGDELAALAAKAEQVRAERFVYLMALLQAGLEMEEHFGKK
ncbi:MAG: hypothetical protein ACHP79_15960 [Terriglobales bacterium]